MQIRRKKWILKRFNGFSILPVEIILQILKLLSEDDLVELLAVNKQFNTIVKGHIEQLPIIRSETDFHKACYESRCISILNAKLPQFNFGSRLETIVWCYEKSIIRHYSLFTKKALIYQCMKLGGFFYRCSCKNQPCRMCFSYSNPMYFDMYRWMPKYKAYLEKKYTNFISRLSRYHPDSIYAFGIGSWIIDGIIDE